MTTASWASALPPTTWTLPPRRSRCAPASWWWTVRSSPRMRPWAITSSIS